MLSNVLKAHGWENYVTWAFLAQPLAAAISPLVFAAAADQRYNAERLLGCVLLGCSVLQFAAYQVLSTGGSPRVFLVLLLLAAVSTSPAWAILSAIVLTHAPDSARSYGLYRVWGTLGWILAGWLVSALGVDQSAAVGKLAAWDLVFAGAMCFLLPATPPRPVARRTWQDAVGLPAFRILAHRDIAVFLGTSFLFSIPLMAFYMQTPPLLLALGQKRVALAMTLGQITEVLALLSLGFLITRWRIKWLLLVALAAGTLRFAGLAMGAAQDCLGWALAAISLHGFCWTFFFEAGRVFLNRRVESGMRAQVQALMTFLTAGAGSILGALLTGALHDGLVIGDKPAGWRDFWMVLALICGACGLFFAVGYRGIGQSTRAKDASATPLH